MKTSLLFGLFAVLFVGMIGPVMAESITGESQKYEQKRQEIEKRYHLEFQSLEKQYAQVKMEIYQKIEANPQLTEDEKNSMFEQFIREFDEKRKNLEHKKMQELEELKMSYKDYVHPDYKYDDSIKSNYQKHRQVMSHILMILNGRQ
ncbi:MAG: hypothetical protein HC944_05195 [Nanoarchaeota archaeon]|nr:hypothetical protein [Nanoarchaeota archaeon]